MIPGTVYRSPGIYLTVEKNPGKLQLGDRPMKAMLTYMYYILIEYDIRDRRNVSISCSVFVCAFRTRSLNFFGNSYLFLFLFFVLFVIRYFSFHVVY